MADVDPTSSPTQATSLSGQVDGQLQRARKDHDAKLQAIMNLLAQLIDVPKPASEAPSITGADVNVISETVKTMEKNVLQSIGHHLETLKVSLAAIDSTIKTHTKSERLISLAGLEVVPKLTSLEYADCFNEWRYALTGFLCFHPAALTHLRLQAYDVGMNPADPNGCTANYNRNLDHELAGIVYLTVNHKIADSIMRTVNSFKGSLLAQAILREIKRYYPSADL